MNIVAAGISRALERGATPSGAAGPVDRLHLARFTMGNLDLEIEVLNLFVDQAPEYLDGLRLAATPKAWRDAAHTLKGSSRSIGAWRLAKLAEQAETLASLQSGFDQPEARAQVIGDVEAAMAEVVVYVRGLSAVAA